MQACWADQVIAESDDTVVVENNHYFPADAVNADYLRASQHTSHCHWKGKAQYYDVVVNGQINANAAWHYPEPKAAAAEIRGRIAFWQGVEVSAC